MRIGHTTARMGRKWATLDPAYSECKQGHHQSPIDIRHTEKADLPPIQFDYPPLRRSTSSTTVTPLW